MLSAPGIEVEVRRAPYGYTVRDSRGEVLRTLDAPRGDDAGYSAIAWTTGEHRWASSPAVKGHFTFFPVYDPWREGWTVVEATTPTPTSLDLVLRGNGGRGRARLLLHHEVRASTLRVEASLDDPEGVVPRAWASGFETDAGEAFLGFGERFNRTNQRGVSVYNWAEEGGFGTGEGELAGPENPAPNGEAMSYYPVPFFVSTRNYAFWLDTTWRSTFDLATEHEDAWRVWTIAPELAYEVLVRIPDDPRGVPDQLVDQFTARTGRPMLPPAWAYGPRRRINRGAMQMGVPEIQAMRDLDLAITSADDALHFLPAGSHVGIETELRAWVDSGHALGYRMLGYYNSLLADTEDSPIRDVVDEAIANRWVLTKPDGRLSVVELISGDLLPILHLDVTSPDAVTFFQGMFDWATDLGYDGWMQDFGEWVQWDVLAANGMTGEEVHNLYPVLYHRAVHDHLEAGPRAGDWLGFVRSGYTGSSQYTPMTWSGDPAASFEDSDGLPSIVRGAINMGISGAPNWGSDIGGFTCVADGHAAANGELVARWIQAGALHPNMMDQDACVLALDPGEKASIWTAPEAMESWRVYARLHTRLFPYFYTLGHRAHQTGAPIVRHVYFEHPDRPELASVDDVFYVGSAILVAPVIERGATTRTFMVPPGEYLDWRDASRLTAETETTVPAPLTELPIFLRAGYLIPMLDPSIDTLSEIETHPDVVGPGDVAGVYDVVGVLSTASSTASFTLWDGTVVEATHGGAFAPPAGLSEAMREEDLADCMRGCWRRDTLGIGVERIRITHDGDTLVAGGLQLRSTTGRRTRWDLYILPE